MTFKKSIVLFAALCSMLFVGSAMAANNVAVNVTSEAIALDSTCSKAGGFALLFDKSTQIMEGDQLIIKLPLGVTICTEGGFNYYITTDLTTTGTAPVIDGFVQADVAGITNPTIDTEPAYFTEAGGTSTGVGSIFGEVAFHVTGSEGDQFIYVDVIGETAGALNDYVNVGPDDGDVFTLMFLDQKTFGTANVVGDLYTYNTNGGAPDTVTETTVAENTLCINVSDPSFTATVVNASMDSAADKFKYIPSNPQIADIVNPTTYAQYICKRDNPVYVSLARRAEQSMDCSAAFDIDDASAALCNYPTENGFNVIIRNTTSVIPADLYEVSMEVLVNGLTGDNGVYFTNASPVVYTYANAQDVCDGLSASGSAGLSIANWFASDGDDIIPADLGGPSYANCNVEDVARATQIVSEVSNLGVTGTTRALLFDIPAFRYDLDEVAAGDVVTVRIKLTLPPCKDIFTIDVKVATFGCADTTSTTLLFPYYTTMATDAWWDGMVVSNIGSTAGTFTAYIYEADGDQGKYTSASIASGKQYVGLLSSMVASATKTGGAGTLGDATCYIWVVANFSADGFAMMGSTADSAVDGSESIGYLPRNKEIAGDSLSYQAQ
jgi:hypothetical protein